MSLMQQPERQNDGMLNAKLKRSLSTSIGSSSTLPLLDAQLVPGLQLAAQHERDLTCIAYCTRVVAWQGSVPPWSGIARRAGKNALEIQNECQTVMLVNVSRLYDSLVNVDVTLRTFQTTKRIINIGGNILDQELTILSRMTIVAIDEEALTASREKLQRANF